MIVLNQYIPWYTYIQDKPFECIILGIIHLNFVTHGKFYIFAILPEQFSECVQAGNPTSYFQSPSF